MIKEYLAGRKQRIEAGEFGSILVGKAVRFKRDLQYRKLEKEAEKMREENRKFKIGKLSIQYGIPFEDVENIIYEIEELSKHADIVRSILEETESFNDRELEIACKYLKSTKRDIELEDNISLIPGEFNHIQDKLDELGGK